MLLLSALLGSIVSLIIFWKLANLALTHALHCSICRQRCEDIFNEHTPDPATPCFWKRFTQRAR